MSDLDLTAQIVPFQYGATAVRTVTINAEPWFVLTDLCNVLALTNVTRVAERLDHLTLSRTQVQNERGQLREAVIVNEAGMYEVVIRSDKPEAAVFRRWLTGTVLPEIRRTGSYSPAPALTPAEQMAHGLIAAQTIIAEKDQTIAELTPKADLADSYLIAQGGARLVREVAKVLGIKQVELRRFLIDEKLIFAKHAPCGDIQYDHYSQFTHHFQTRETVVNHTWGTCSHYTLHILPRCVELILARRRNLTAAGASNGGDLR